MLMRKESKVLASTSGIGFNGPYNRHCKHSQKLLNVHFIMMSRRNSCLVSNDGNYENISAAVIELQGLPQLGGPSLSSSSALRMGEGRTMRNASSALIGTKRSAATERFQCEQENSTHDVEKHYAAFGNRKGEPGSESLQESVVGCGMMRRQLRQILEGETNLPEVAFPGLHG